MFAACGEQAELPGLADQSARCFHIFMAFAGERESFRCLAAHHKQVTAQYCAICQPIWKSLLRGNCSRFLQWVEGSLLIATPKMQDSRMPERISQAVRVAQRSTPEYRLLGL